MFDIDGANIGLILIQLALKSFNANFAKKTYYTNNI